MRLDLPTLPETRYAKSGEVHLAYQVFGEGAFDLVFVPGFISHVDHAWDDPNSADFLRRLASFSRVICFDKRGTGLSDRVSEMPTLEQRMDDVRVVMDAVGSERAALLGISEGGPMSLLFAASHPDRTHALALIGSYARFSTDVMPPVTLAAFLDHVDRRWGTGETAPSIAPSLAADASLRSWWARFERLGASPSAVKTLMQMNNQIDVRDVLPAIRVPTLILHARGDKRVAVAGGRYLAKHIAGARFVELPGDDHFFAGADAGRALDEIEEFLTGERPQAEFDRVLATVMLTDIVESTRRATEVGDSEWKALLERHNARVRRELARFRGREVKSLGDGFLATFDGPARAVRCAVSIRDGVRELGIELRCGVHTGEIELLGDDIGGIAVHLTARVAHLARAGEILTSNTVRDLVAGSGLRFQDRGNHSLKGISDSVAIYAVASAPPAA